MSRLSTLLLAGILVLTSAPVLGQAESPAPLETGAPAPHGRDLYLDMPAHMGGSDSEIVIVRGEEHFAGLGADDPARAPLEALIAAAGAEVADLTTGYAVVASDDLFSFVVGIRVDGAAPGSLMPAYLPFLFKDLVEPASVNARIAGRDVLLVTSIVEDDEHVELVVYDQGDTLWMLQGPTDTVETVLRDLPQT